MTWREHFQVLLFVIVNGEAYETVKFIIYDSLTHDKPTDGVCAEGVWFT